MSMPGRKNGGWERAKELEKKKRHEVEEFKLRHKLTSLFPVLEKDATGPTAGRGACGAYC